MEWNALTQVLDLPTKGSVRGEKEEGRGCNLKVNPESTASHGGRDHKCV